MSVYLFQQFSNHPKKMYDFCNYSVISLEGRSGLLTSTVLGKGTLLPLTSFEHYQENKIQLSFHCHEWKNFQIKVHDYLSDACFRQLKVLLNI